MNRPFKSVRRAIGGDFELTTVPTGPPARLLRLTRGRRGTWTLSGRAALGAVLRVLWDRGVRHVHLPAYLCDSLLQPVRALGFSWSFYPVDLELAGQPDPPLGSVVLVIHYFGWLNPAARQLTPDSGNRFFLIEDASQALLSGWAVPVAGERFVILSPRKFGPTPLGGWCSAEVPVPPASEEVAEMADRALAARLARGRYLATADAGVDRDTEDWYLASGRRLEAFLDEDREFPGAPRSTLDIIAGIDWPAAAVRRRENWLVLSEALSDRLPRLHDAMPDDVAPLGLVVRVPAREHVRAGLRERRIFCPVHWRLPAEVSRTEFPHSARLAEELLTLPIDQRYRREDMVRLATALHDLRDVG